MSGSMHRTNLAAALPTRISVAVKLTQAAIGPGGTTCTFPWWYTAATAFDAPRSTPITATEPWNHRIHIPEQRIERAAMPRWRAAINW